MSVIPLKMSTMTPATPAHALIRGMGVRALTLIAKQMSRYKCARAKAFFFGVRELSVFVEVS